MGGAAYSIRNIQSSKKITVAATGKDPGTGKMKTEEYTVNGPVAVMITTTAAELEGETASRFLFLTIDESTKMTEAIHRMQREAETLNGLIRRKKQDCIIKKHHNAQRLLKPLAVVNAFTKYLSYPNRSLRTRRDHKKYLGLIRAIAFLYQYQRAIKTVDVQGKPVEYIKVTLDDIDKANQLADEVLGQSLDELARPSRTLLCAIYKMVKEISDKRNSSLDEVFFTRRMIRKYTGWSDWQIKAHIKQLEELEYLHVRIGARGKEYSYALNYQGQGGDDSRFYLNLTPIEEIKKLMGRSCATTPQVNKDQGAKPHVYFTVAGQYFDQEIGLHYNWHRYFDPKIGRYLTPDPIGLRGGINLFVYAGNNPINAVDPFGLMSATSAAAIKAIMENKKISLQEKMEIIKNIPKNLPDPNLHNPQMIHDFPTSEIVRAGKKAIYETPPPSEKFLTDLSQQSAIFGTGCALAGAEPAAAVFGGIALSSNALRIYLYSDDIAGESARDSAKLFVPPPYNLFSDPIIDNLYYYYQNDF